MNTTMNRLNAVSALATSTLLALLAIIAYVSYPTGHAPTGKLIVNSLEVVQGRAQWHQDRRRQDYLKVNFDAELDLRPLFNWNTKQVFLSLAANYESAAHAQNTVVVWDRIVRRKQDARVYIEEATNKYGFKEVSKSFNNIQNATFTLKWNVMPHVGLLAYGDEATSGSMAVPKRVPGDKNSKPETIWY